MHSNWYLVGLVTIITLALPFLNTASPLKSSSLENRICQINEGTTVICYVQCFEDITSVLPKETNVGLIKHLIVRQTNSRCYPDVGLKIFNEFTSLRVLHYTGAVCPFSLLPNLTSVVDLTLTLSTEAAPSREEFIWNNSTHSELPIIEKMAINEICCGLFQGTIVAPLLQELSFRCSKVSSYVSGVHEPRDNLVLVTPDLKILDYQESASGFPVSSASNLPHLQSLFVSINMEFTEDRVITSNSLNLPSVRELIFTQGEFGNIHGLKAYQCLELGETNLTRVTIIHPPTGSTTCPSIWRCISCSSSPQSSSEDAQFIDMFIQSSTTAKFSSFLPNETLNTTKLIFNHAPLLQVDGEAMRRFPHLQHFRVGEINGLHPYNGIAVLMGNPFRALQNPQTFHFLHLALLKCDCEVYNTFAWLKTQNPTFEGELQCINVPPARRIEERIGVNKSISITNFLKKLSKRCATPSTRERVYTLTAEQTAPQTPSLTTTTVAITTIITSGTPTITTASAITTMPMTTTTTTIKTTETTATSDAVLRLLPATTTTYAFLFLSQLL